MHKWLFCRTDSEEQRITQTPKFIESWDSYQERRKTKGQKLLLAYAYLAKPIDNKLIDLFQQYHTHDDTKAGEILNLRFKLTSDKPIIHQLSYNLQVMEEFIDKHNQYKSDRP